MDIIKIVSAELEELSGRKMTLAVGEAFPLCYGLAQPPPGLVKGLYKKLFTTRDPAESLLGCNLHINVTTVMWQCSDGVRGNIPTRFTADRNIRCVAPFDGFPTSLYGDVGEGAVVEGDEERFRVRWGRRHGSAAEVAAAGDLPWPCATARLSLYGEDMRQAGASNLAFARESDFEAAWQQRPLSLHQAIRQWQPVVEPDEARLPELFVEDANGSVTLETPFGTQKFQRIPGSTFREGIAPEEVWHERQQLVQSHLKAGQVVWVGWDAPTAAGRQALAIRWPASMEAELPPPDWEQSTVMARWADLHD